MTKATNAAYQRLLQAIGKEAEKLQGREYYDLLNELATHLEGLIEGYKEENPGEDN